MNLRCLSQHLFLLSLYGQNLLVNSTPLAANRGVQARSLGKCALVDDILAIIHLPQISAEATKFCSSYIHIPIVTSVHTSRSTFSPPLATVLATATEPAVTTTKTDVEPTVTVTKTAVQPTLTTTTTEIELDVTITKTVDITPLPTTDIFTSTSTIITISTTLDGVPEKRGILNGPALLSQFLGSRLSSACSCLSITPSTTLISTTTTTSLTALTITDTSSTTPIITITTTTTPTITTTTSTTPAATFTISTTPTDTNTITTTLSPSIVDITFTTSTTTSTTSITYGLAPQCVPTAISGGQVSLRQNTGIDFIAGAGQTSNGPPSSYGPVNDVYECCSACYFFNACYVFTYSAANNQCILYSDTQCSQDFDAVVTQGQGGIELGAGPCVVDILKT